MHSYLITDTSTLHSRIDYATGNEFTGVRPDYSLLSDTYLAVIADQQNTDERGALEYLGVTIDEDGEQWLIES